MKKAIYSTVYKKKAKILCLFNATLTTQITCSNNAKQRVNVVAFTALVSKVAK